ncbi:MAG: TIGR03663 family protein, partial [Planctomycetes bacterium]|nr:TIGR03663 family protein [Planctomycetota bacterium]
MRSLKTCFLLILAVTLAAAAIRLPRLAQRPMHTDEAIHAYKFGTLLEAGEYVYNPDEYHGPTLNYFTMLPAKLCGQKTYQQINEFTLRVVPVAFGILLVLLAIGVADGMGRPAAIMAAILTAVSHAMIFYSRYYIQETLLVCFTFGVIVCGWRYARSRRPGWAVGAGICVGFMHATKETFVIAMAAMAAALLLTLILRKRGAGVPAEIVRKVNRKHIALGLVAAGVVSAILFSCFFKNPRGIIDSVLTYKTYLDRAGNNQIHAHPWYYYLQILIFSRLGDGPIWSEAPIVVLAIVGFVAAITKRGIKNVDFDFLRFIGFYTLIMTVAYSCIRYKTPWCLMGFLHGMILLAGVGAVVLVRLAPPKLPRTIVVLLLAAGVLGLLWQGCVGAYKYYDDHANPYVYAHTSSDIFAMTESVEKMAALHPAGKAMPIEVICPGGDHWPFPWYLRSFSQVGYYNEVDMTTSPAPVIIAYASLEQEVLTKIYTVPPPGEKSLYVPLFDSYMELRPTIELRGYVINDLYEKQFEPPKLEELESKMEKEPPEVVLVNSQGDAIEGICRFSHEAMATTFEVLIQHDDREYARQAALEAFNEIDRIEQELSSFVENSDIGRINTAVVNKPVNVGLETFACLEIACRLCAETYGAFDVTIGSLFECLLDANKQPRAVDQLRLAAARSRTGSHLLKLDGKMHTVSVSAVGVKVDLGGIGKGFAVDKVARLLREWSIDKAMIHGGYSTVLAMEAPADSAGWPITFSNPLDRKETIARLMIENEAVSGSGLEQGVHIIDPRQAKPVAGKLASWSSARDAATADALSTAFMVMSPEEI